MEMLRVPFEHGATTAPVRQSTRAILHRHHGDEYLEDVLLVVTELVQNVSQHTAGGGELLLTMHDDAVLIEVSDTDPIVPVPQPRDPHRPGGRGLILVAG